MISTDINGKNLSTSFNSAVASSSQYIKPKVLIDFLDSRHCSNKSVTVNIAHSSEAIGELGYFFSSDQLLNGINRQAFTWGVADALDINGKTITANGNWYAVPPNKSDNYEFGWWSSNKSTSSQHVTYNGYSFATDPLITINFDNRKCNKIIVYTPEFYGQIDTYTIIVRSNDVGVPNPLYQETSRIDDGEYYSVHYLPSTVGHDSIYRVEIQVHSTKNPLDHARIESVDILYQEDISDYTISYSYEKTRDLHESSLPIAGTSSGSLSVILDNAEKKFNIFGSTSDFGPYMKKDLRVYVTSGWKISDYDGQFVVKETRQSMSNADMTISLVNTNDLPSGGVGDYFILEIEPNSINRELVLCNTKVDDYTINIVQRGYGETKAKAHSSGVEVRFETFEYPAFTNFYVDEWSSDTSQMTTSMTCADWGKYLNEIILTDGFFIEKATVPEACELLTYRANFPKADIRSLNRFDISAKKSNAILHLDFNESAIDRSGNTVIASDSLRARLFAMPAGSLNKVRDITADAIDRELTQLEKALGEISFIPPDFTAVSSDISSNTDLALDLVDFFFIKNEEPQPSSPPPVVPIVAATIDLDQRLPVRLPSGEIATVRSISVEYDGIQILIATIGPNGEDWDPDTNDGYNAAVNYYLTTDQHLGKFLTIEDATSYGIWLSAEEFKRVSAYVFENYNMVFDGFYIPNLSGEQYLVIDIANGGVRVYLDDTLIINQWKLNPVSVGQYKTIESIPLYLTAGEPYKIRIEAFHELGNFSIKLKKAFGASPPVMVYSDEVKTIAAIDKIGSRNAAFTLNSLNRNKHNNYGIYLNEPAIGVSGGLASNSENKYCILSSNSYVRIPYHSSWDLNNSSSNNYNNGSWTIETYLLTPSVYSSDGEFLSSWSNSSPTSGFEFYSNSTSNGFKIITSSGTESVSSNTALSNSSFTHLVVTFDGSDLKYYVNGDLQDSATLAGSIQSWSNDTITIGGRGASYTAGTGEVEPSVKRNLYIDEFLMYPHPLTSDQVKDRYTEAQMKELTIYPFLYGGESSIRQIIDEITLADLGRFYIDEENIAKYEHYYALWEDTIDRHANIQLTINDDNTIISANYVVQLQANKVVVKVAGISSNLVGLQGLWRADDPTTLAVVNLTQNISNSATSLYVSTTTDPPFSKAGYIVIDDEIIKYNNTEPNAFLNLERGQFGTTPASHTANTSVREARYWDIKYDKAPAFQVKNPFITGIAFEEPDEIAILRWIPGNYGAELLICASNNVAKGSIVFAEGTNPLTEKVAYTAVAGIPVILTEQNSQVKEQVVSADSFTYGIKEIIIENKFITDFVHAQKIAQFIIDKNSLPVPVLNLSTIPTPKLKVGDRIRISDLDAFDIINGEYWVISKQYDYGDSINQSLILRAVN